MEEKKKPIFFFLGSLKHGGTEMVALRIQKGLSDRGYSVYFILLKDIVELPISNSEQVLHLHTEKYSNKILKILYAYYGLWTYYIKYKPKRIISFSSGLNILLLFSFLPNQIFTVDTNLFWVKRNLFRRRLLKIIGYVPFVKRVIVPSNELREKFKNYINALGYKKFVTIYNPFPQIDENLFLGSRDHIPENYIVSVGRLTKYKGFEQLIRCFKKANFNNDPFLLILGSGPLKGDLESLIEDLEMQNRIKLLGYVKHPEIYISSSQALILNSSFESFGNVLVEGLFLGVPVISNDCDFGPREIVKPGINGLLYDQEMDKNLIEVLENFMNNKEIREKLKKGTSTGIEKFETDAIVQQWITKIIH